MDFSSIEISEYNITTDPSLFNEKYDITPEIAEVLREMYPKSQRGTPSVIKKLKRCCRRYPHIPQFKNQLGAAYEKAGKREEMLALNRQIVEEHPEYLYGKLTHSTILIQEGEPEKVPDILGEKMDLKALYPDRETFHLREILGFFNVCVKYYLAVDKLDHVDPYLQIMNKIGADEPETKQAKDARMQYIMEAAARRREEENERRRSVESRSYDKSVQTSEPPAFYHPEMEALYSNDMRIDHELVREILALPRESLIGDLEMAVKDSIRRFEHFRDLCEQPGEGRDKEFSFLFHALFMLAELEAEQSLPVILRLLRQGEELLHFWFAYDLSEIGVEVLYYIGRNRLDDLQAFMREPDNFTYARGTVDTAVTQLAIHRPGRRDEVIAWFEELFLFFLDNRENDRIIDTDQISLMVAETVDLRALELEELIRELYKHNLVERGIAGTADEIIRDIKSERHPPERYEIYDIYSRYDHLSEIWYSDPSDNTGESSFQAALQESPDNEPPDYMSAVPFEKSDDVGRNDPCPCGSGRKYKHCCME